MVDCAVVSTMSNMSSNTPKKKMFIECIRFLFPTITIKYRFTLFY